MAMKFCKQTTLTIAFLAAAVPFAGLGADAAQGDDSGMGPGMMMGPGMGGYGMGPGTMMGPGMGGYGMGPGMMMGPGMGGYGMGPGMMMGPGMGGYGMGPGMMMGPGMGGYGMGPGMMDLSDSQREQVQSIQESLQKEHADVMGKMTDLSAELQRAYGAEKPDPKQVGDLYGQMAKLRQQMIEAHVQAHNRMVDMLTDEQRQQLQQRSRGGGAGVMGGPGMMRGGQMIQNQ